MTRRPEGPRFRLVKTPRGTGAFAVRGGLLVRCWLPFLDAEALRGEVSREFPGAAEDRRLEPDFAAAYRDFFAGRPRAFPLAPDLASATPFRRAVYEALMRVPWGETISYADLARRAGSPGAARAVGAAMARNPFPPVVPCHRVLGADGSLRGFSAEGGIASKGVLLSMEAVPLAGQGSPC